MRLVGQQRAQSRSASGRLVVEMSQRNLRCAASAPLTGAPLPQKASGGTAGGAAAHACTVIHACEVSLCSLPERFCRPLFCKH